MTADSQFRDRVRISMSWRGMNTVSGIKEADSKSHKNSRTRGWPIEVGVRNRVGGTLGLRRLPWDFKNSGVETVNFNHVSHVGK